MNRLRQLSSRGLAALLVALVAGATVLVVGASALVGGGSPPPSGVPLAQTVHAALAAKPVPGVTADITFTNNLIDAASLAGGRSPLLAGAHGRLWASTDGRFRLELQAARGQDTNIVVDGRRFWAYESGSNTVYQGTLPQHHRTTRSAPEKPHALPTVAEIQKQINELAQHLNVSDPPSAGITAGQPSYTVAFSPQHDGGLLGSARLAWDAVTGVPLRAAIYAQGDAKPVLELVATNVKYSVAPGDFAASPPAGAKVVDVKLPQSTAGKMGGAKSRAHKATRQPDVSGVAAVQAKLPFPLDAPPTLAQLPRTGVRLLQLGGKPAALVTYGQHLGAIAVLERSADPHGTAPKPTPAGNDPHGDGQTSLPTVSVNGATGQELPTALGTVITFDRKTVSYVIAGSVPARAAEDAARGL